MFPTFSKQFCFQNPIQNKRSERMTKNLFSSSIRFFMLAVFCLALGIGQSLAQSTVTGGIRGTVTDAQGAVVPNATVTITNTGTNQTQDTTADEDGGFRFSNLQPGVYSIKASSTGFADF